MKKILSLALALIMVMSLFNGVTVTAASGTCGTNVNWSLDSDGVLTISGEGKMTNYTDFSEVPWYNYRSSVKFVDIEDGVTSIGNNAFFDCESLTDVMISDSVKNIGVSAFEFCHSLTSITIPNNVTSISDNTFKYCNSLNKIVMPQGLINIGFSAFAYCESLNEITIPDSVTTIGSCAFDSCTSLSSIEIPNGIDVINNYTFRETSLTKVTVPNSVESIGDHAFYDCDSLTELTIPNSVKSIGDHAFYDCDSLTELTIPQSVTSIGNDAFNRCGSLELIIVESGNMVYHSIGNCLIETNTNTLVTGCKNSIIPNDGSVTVIDDYAFQDCTLLYEITIPSCITSIGYSAFSNCTSLVEAKIHTMIKRIDSFTFFCCQSLTKIEIPVSVKSIGFAAFNACDSLTDVYYTGTEDEWNDISMGGDNWYLTNAKIHFNSSMPVSGVEVSGSVKAYGDATRDVTVELLDGETVVDTKTVTGNSGTYIFEEVEAGTYTVRVSKTKHATREYEITVGDSNVTQDAVIWLYGDVTGDGIINAGDTLQINRKVANLSSVFNLAEDTDYRFKVANVTNLVMGDVILNAADTLQINRKVANLSSIFDTIA